MKSDVMPSIVQMDKEELQHLTAEVKETVATGINMQANAKSSSFKAIDLWNIRRNGRFVNSGSKRKKSTSISLTHVSF